MTYLTAEYIDEHLDQVHTADSFARSFAYQMLTAAKEKVGDKSSEVTMDCKVSVSPIEKFGCIRVCVNTPIGRICYHVKV